MRFGIITLVSDNYGNKYQNYAVEQLLADYGEVETFGLENLYYPQHSENCITLLSKLRPRYIRDVLIYRCMYQYSINRVDKGVLHNILNIMFHGKKLKQLIEERGKRFANFEEEKLHISSQRLNRDNTGREWSSQFDYFICGSDQIWNPTYATTSELAFCSFAPEKTICMAPSFGVSAVPGQRVAEYAENLQKIYQLSVREKAGQKIIEKLTGKLPPVLLDPTMAIPLTKWEELCEKPQNRLPDKYIAGYFLGQIDREYEQKIQQFGKKKELPVIMLFDVTTPEYYLYNPSEVLYVIRHADYVLTDSFHGCVFSILFHKNFIVFSRNEGKVSMNSRIETLLETFHLQDRSTGDEEAVAPEKWIAVDQILEAERYRTRNYILEAIGKDR